MKTDTKTIKWKAQWIWLKELIDTPNTYVLFRRKFRCASTDGQPAFLHVTAGHFYRVYLNGRYLGRGPDRCYYREKFFHTYEVSRFLKRGENVIAVQCHFLGSSDLSIMERHATGPAGLLAQLEIDGRAVVVSDDSWKAARNPAYAMDTVPPNFHREWMESYHVDEEPAGWQRLRFDDRAWQKPSIVAKAEGGPWQHLVPRQTPELTAKVMTAGNAYIDNPQYLMNETPEYNVDAFLNLGTGKPDRTAGAFTIRNGRRKVQRILFDMGCIRAGMPRIDISRCHGGKIEIYYGDTLSMMHCDTLHLGKKPVVWTPFTLRGGRYFRLDISGADTPITLRSVRWIKTNYPVAKRATFRCSDDQLNTVWEMCVRSAEACGMEHFVDCVQREQVLWMMDFRFQAPQHYHFFGDTGLALKCFRQFANLQLESGHILCYGPSSRPLEDIQAGVGGRPACDFFGFNFYFIIAVWEYFQFTGDLTFLKEFQPVCRRCLDYHYANEKKGFAHVGDIKGRSFVDWGYEGFVSNKEAVYSFTQALYYGAQDAYRRMCRELGLESEATKTGARAARLKRKFMKVFVEPRTGRIADCVVGARRRMKGTVHPYIAAARFLDAVPRKMMDFWLDSIDDAGLSPSCSGFGTTLAVEALQKQGRRRQALALIRRYWGAMVDSGLPQTPEFFDARLARGSGHQWAPGTSMCHSYASMAGVLLQQIILGATVEGRKVTVAPWFGKLTSARGVVPTLYGDVRLSWTRQGDIVHVRVDAPEGLDVHCEPADDRSVRIQTSTRSNA